MAALTLRLSRHVLVALVLSTAALVGPAPVPSPARADDVKSHPFFGDKAPPFQLQTVTGDTVSLASLKGKYAIIHFAATW